MSALFASRVARRRTVTYIALLVTSLLLMAISGNPLVRDLQHGIGFAFVPFEETIDGIAHDVASIGTALADIDRLRVENEALHQENDQLRVDSRSVEEI